MAVNHERALGAARLLRDSCADKPGRSADKDTQNGFRRRRPGAILWIGFGFLAFLRPLGAEGKLLFEIIAAEGMCFTEYNSALLGLEPHEFAEFNHAPGVNACLFHSLEWFGVGACLGCIYNTGHKLWKDEGCGVDQTTE